MENSKYTVSLGMPAGRARLNEFAMVAMVTILENDDPYKVFEIVTMDGLSGPLSVEEDVGNITFFVKRSQPAFGNASVTFLFVNGTALFIPDMGIFDYQPVNSELDFPEGISSQIITVGIHDEQEPEINETFVVMLQDPSKGAVLSPVPAIEVTILSNDAAHGVVRFDEGSISQVIAEAEMENSIVVLMVRRDGGTIGQVCVAWQLSGNHPQGEITPASGEN